MMSGGNKGGRREVHTSCFHIMCTIYCVLAMCYLSISAAAFGVIHPFCRSQIQDSALFAVSSEFGAVSASSSPPRLDPFLIEAARVRLPWEEIIENDSNEVACLSEEMISSGQQWFQTRQLLTRLWVLPRDMSNGSWEAYTKAANNGEDRMLSCVPQLLRLPPEDIERSAKTVLSVLKLPPALLRREPLLLTVPSDLLVRGFGKLLCGERDIIISEGKDTRCVTQEGSDEETRLNVLEACKETPGLLLEAATQD